MKCKKCKGTGVREDKHGFTMYCPDCHGTGKVKVKNKPQTNEEWFCGLPTEEKANVLSNATYSSVFCSDILVLGKEAEQKKWELWLKEKRNEIC